MDVIDDSDPLFRKGTLPLPALLARGPAPRQPAFSRAPLAADPLLGDGARASSAGTDPGPGVRTWPTFARSGPERSGPRSAGNRPRPLAGDSSQGRGRGNSQLELRGRQCP